MEIISFTKAFSTLYDMVALDTLYLEQLNRHPSHGILWFWEAESYGIVLGHSNKFKEEINHHQCLKDKIPVVRRTSGGGTVLQGPGCLNYSLILPLSYNPDLQSITKTTRYILQRHCDALIKEHIDATIKGISDLTLKSLKFSGNAQKRLKHALLFHGTILYQFDTDRIGRYLQLPEKQPQYRQQREHGSFVTNLPCTANDLKKWFINQWQTIPGSIDVAQENIEKLAKTYAQQEWVHKF